jgi:hypothetical protein
MGVHLTTAEAANWLGIEKRTLEDWRSNEIGPPYVVYSPRCIRYSMEDLIKWRNERRHVHSDTAHASITHPKYRKVK